MANNEAESKDDQSSVPKSKLSKWNFQQSWLEMYKMAEVRSTKGYVLFASSKIKETRSFYHWLCKIQDLNTSS